MILRDVPKAEHSVKIAPDADKKIPLAQARKRTSSKKSKKKEEKPYCISLQILTNGWNDTGAIYNFEANIYSRAVV